MVAEVDLQDFHIDPDGHLVCDAETDDLADPTRCIHHRLKHPCAENSPAGLSLLDAHVQDDIVDIIPGGT